MDTPATEAPIVEGWGGGEETARPQQGEPLFVCDYPGCGKQFSRSQALGAHKKQVHGIAGKSSRTAVRKKRGEAAKPANTRQRRQPSIAEVKGLDTDRLLTDLFPNGIPARRDVLEATAIWLGEAERIAGMK